MTPKQRLLAARFAYVTIVLLATLTQLDFSPDLAAAGQRLARAFTPSLGWRDAIDALRNLALFAGLGAVWVVTSVSGKVREEIHRATLVAVGLSVTVEGLQVFSPVRTASLVDVTTNTLGALAGALMVPLLIVEVRRAKGTRLYVGVPTVHAWLAAALGAGVALAAELTHWLLGLSIRWEAAATHALALGLGAWAAHRRLAPLTQALRGSTRARAAIFAY